MRGEGDGDDSKDRRGGRGKRTQQQNQLQTVRWCTRTHIDVDDLALGVDGLLRTRLGPSLGRTIVSIATHTSLTGRPSLLPDLHFPHPSCVAHALRLVLLQVPWVVQIAEKRAALWRSHETVRLGEVVLGRQEGQAGQCTQPAGGRPLAGGAATEHHVDVKAVRYEIDGGY